MSNEMYVTLFCVTALLFGLLVLRAVWLLFVNVISTAIVAAIASIPGVALYRMWPTVSTTAYTVDPWLVGAWMLCGVGALLMAVGFELAHRKGWKRDGAAGEFMTAGPALLWATLWFVFLRSLGPLHFEFLGKHLVGNTSLQFQSLFFFVMFVSEYLANKTMIEAKVAAVVTFAGKRRGDAVAEGWHSVPGILPLMLQVMVYALFRFNIFYDVVRKVSTSPVVFSGTVVARTRDYKFVVLQAAVTYGVTNPEKIDDLADDTSTDPRQQVRNVVAGHFAGKVALFVERVSWQQLHNGGGLTAELRQFLADAAAEVGSHLQHLEVVWLGFREPHLQRIFQEFASADLREDVHRVKADEIERLLARLRETNPHATHMDAERIWEAFNKTGRGSFRFET